MVGIKYSQVPLFYSRRPLSKIAMPPLCSFFHVVHKNYGRLATHRTFNDVSMAELLFVTQK